MAGPFYVGDRPTLSRPIVRTPPYRVQAIVTDPNGVDTVYNATVGASSVSFQPTTFTLGSDKPYNLRWTMWSAFGESATSKSYEEQFYVHPTRFSTPFLKPRFTQTTIPGWKHNGWGVTTLSQMLTRTPRTGDIIVLYVWNVAASSTSTIGGGTQGWTRVWNLSNGAGISDEIWIKRWGDVGQTDSLTWSIVNTSGVLVCWTVVVRGCLQGGSLASAVDVVSATEGNHATPITAPSVTVTGADRLVLRTYFTGRTPDAAIPGQVQRHITFSDGKPIRIGWGYGNSVNYAHIVSATLSEKDAGAAGTATVVAQGVSQYLWWANTLALKPAT